jgi:hypothetical protein
MSSVHEIIIALSKNNAQSDSINAAPRRWFLRKASIISPVVALAVLSPFAVLCPVAVLAPVAAPDPAPGPVAVLPVLAVFAA